jgi:hypothetical protein
MSGSTGDITLQIGGDQALTIDAQVFTTPAPGKEATHSLALAALDNALDRTTIYLREIEAGRSKYSPVTETEISGLWGVASSAINDFDPALANVCFIKSQGWLDPLVWHSPEFKSMKLGLNDLRLARIKFNTENRPSVLGKAARQKKSSSTVRPANTLPGWYPLAGLGFLAATILILIALIFGPDHSDRTALINVLVSFCAAGSATFIGGTAAAKGKIPLPGVASSPLEYSAGGGVAVLIVTMVLMFWLNPVPSTDKSPASAISEQSIKEAAAEDHLLVGPQKAATPDQTNDAPTKDASRPESMSGSKSDTAPLPTITAVQNNGSINTQINCVIMINADLPDTRIIRTQRCGLSEPQKRNAALENINNAIAMLNDLQRAKSTYFFPALDDYRVHHEPEYWQVVLDQAHVINDLVGEAVKSLVKIDPSANANLTSDLRILSGNLRMRGETMHALALMRGLPSSDQIDSIEDKQRELYKRLTLSLEHLRDETASGSINEETRLSNHSPR